MKNVYFGFGCKYDKGIESNVAMNQSDAIVEVHKSVGEDVLWYYIGRCNKATVAWSESIRYGEGSTPSCAVNNQNNVVAVHHSPEGKGLLVLVGTLHGSSIEWGSTQPYDTGRFPRVAINDAGVVVEVHQSSSESKLWYHVGQWNSKSVRWSESLAYDTGEHPSVAINNAGVVVEVHKSEHNSGLWYHVGRISDTAIEWGKSIEYDEGITPSVALTDSGLVIEVHQSQNNSGLWRRVGQINGSSIEWSGGADFDSGKTPCVACGGTYAIQTHGGESESTLWFSTSLIAERASWMQDYFQLLKGKTLKELTLPASHDSAMYISALGKTQHKDIYDQLRYGIRYFDLRPGWDGIDYGIYHGFVPGPSLLSVLEDVQRYMGEGHRELVILKFSHYQAFDASIYEGMVSMIREKLNPWLLRDLPAQKRLADLPLAELIADRGVVLVVCSGDYPVDNTAAGIWVYRDWQAADPEVGDLRVFDKYSDTTSYTTMKSKQLEQFQGYDGTCQQDPGTPCDLFLLSWTLTPVTGVWETCQDANRNLGDVMAGLSVPNQHGAIINLLYVDYVENARVTDVAIFQNGLE